jgi:hypothetical protein
VFMFCSYMSPPDPGFRHVPSGLQLAKWLFIISWVHMVVDNETLRMGAIDQQIQQCQLWGRDKISNGKYETFPTQYIRTTRGSGGNSARARIVCDRLCA